jgi:hypothetical protein
MAISPTDIQILFTNYDITAHFLNLASCSEHFISIKHRILAGTAVFTPDIDEPLLNILQFVYLPGTKLTNK